jgi:predicted transglutaminase-like cysteine proteinase
MTKQKIILAAALSALTIQPGWAMPESRHNELPTTSAIAEGGFTLAPLSYVRFCMNTPDDCLKQGKEDHVALDAEKWHTLVDVNLAVNTRITPNPAAAGRGAWSLTTVSGDCNDYAVQKRHKLLAMGWPSGALSLAVVMTDENKGHLVLSVRTDHGDLVLDNLHDSVVAWDSSNYRWIKRQSASQPQYWVDIKTGAEKAVDNDTGFRVATDTTKLP